MIVARHRGQVSFSASHYEIDYLALFNPSSQKAPTYRLETIVSEHMVARGADRKLEVVGFARRCDNARDSDCWWSAYQNCGGGSDGLTAVKANGTLLINTVRVSHHPTPDGRVYMSVANVNVSNA
jgi:hypothetical protein